jgi:quercetin dioxygenase-like cupin family protein
LPVVLKRNYRDFSAVVTAIRGKKLGGVGEYRCGTDVGHTKVQRTCADVSAPLFRKRPFASVEWSWVKWTDDTSSKRASEASPPDVSIRVHDREQPVISERPPGELPQMPGQTSDSPQTVQILHSDTSWNGSRYAGYPEGVPMLTVVRYSIPARSSLPWHTHGMPNTAFVMSGHIVLTSIEGVTQVFRAGEAFAESVGNEHRGYTEDEGVEIVCTYAGVDGQPLSEPTGRPIDEN